MAEGTYHQEMSYWSRQVSDRFGMWHLRLKPNSEGSIWIVMVHVGQSERGVRREQRSQKYRWLHAIRFRLVNKCVGGISGLSRCDASGVWLLSTWALSGKLDDSANSQVMSLLTSYTSQGEHLPSSFLFILLVFWLWEYVSLVRIPHYLWDILLNPHILECASSFTCMWCFLWVCRPTCV